MFQGRPGLVRVAAVAAASAWCLAAVACRSGSSDPLANVSAKTVATQAIANTKAASSLMIVGNIAQSGTTYSINLGIKGSQGCTGTIGEGSKGSVKLTTIGKTVYMEPDNTFWKANVGSEASMATALLDGKYLKFTTADSGMSAITTMCDVSKLFDSQTTPASVAKEKVTTLGGVQVLPLKDSSDGSVAYVTDTSKPEIVEITGARELLELGSGMASKTRALLFAMAGAGTLERYLPMDVSELVVERCAEELVEMYPGLRVHGVVGDFEQHLEHVPPGEARLVAFLGGTIGNLYPDERAPFLADVRELMGDDGWLVLGTDLVKDRRALEAAYNDSAGVTAEFNRNVLHAINRELDADFDVDSFEHVAFWNETDSWIEMRLRACGPQQVRIEAADLDLELHDGEEIRTEISTKFTRERLEEELRGAGMRVVEFFTDGMFGLTLAAAA